MPRTPAVPPSDTAFQVVRKGYDQAQVERHLRRLEAEMRILVHDRDAAVDQSAQLALELDEARARSERLRAQVRSLVSPPQSIQGMSERMRSMLRMAEDEVAEMLSVAEADAERRIHDADQHAAHELATARAQADEIRAEATRQAELATEEQTRLAGQAEAARHLVDEDFTLAMDQRRKEALKALTAEQLRTRRQAESTRSRAAAEARQAVEAAREQARSIIGQAEQSLSAMTALRGRIAVQLDQARGALEQTVAGLVPLAGEQDTLTRPAPEAIEPAAALAEAPAVEPIETWSAPSEQATSHTDEPAAAEPAETWSDAIEPAPTAAEPVGSWSEPTAAADVDETAPEPSVVQPVETWSSTDEPASTHSDAIETESAAAQPSETWSDAGGSTARADLIEPEIPAAETWSDQGEPAPAVEPAVVSLDHAEPTSDRPGGPDPHSPTAEAAPEPSALPATAWLEQPEPEPSSPPATAWLEQSELEQSEPEPAATHVPQADSEPDRTEVEATTAEIAIADQASPAPADHLDTDTPAPSVEQATAQDDEPEPEAPTTYLPFAPGPAEPEAPQRPRPPSPRSRTSEERPARRGSARRPSPTRAAKPQDGENTDQLDQVPSARNGRARKPAAAPRPRPRPRPADDDDEPARPAPEPVAASDQTAELAVPADRATQPVDDREPPVTPDEPWRSTAAAGRR